MNESALAAFVLARVSEDEAAARTAQEAPEYPHLGDTVAEATLAIALGANGGDERGTIHFARHDPARVLRECEAVRRIVKAHREQVEDDDPYAWIVASEVVLKAFATVWQDHADYQEGWAL